MSSNFDASDESLRIQQDVMGDRNQVIGQAIDSTIVNFVGEGQVINLTVYDRIPKEVSQPTVSTARSLTHQEYRQRKVLLNKVKEYWIKGVLEASLHTKALIELGLEEWFDAVQRPFSGLEAFPDATERTLPQAMNATTVFNQMGEGRTLLVLGEPGSGKTITLLKLAQDLIAKVEEDLGQPIPVVFNLSSWARKTWSIEKWLVQELVEKYQVSQALGKSWVETESLLLLLDGLDEVKAEYRNTCVQALNQFMQMHGTTEIVICCRIKDYQTLANRLMLQSAICIQPLSSKQVDYYLDQAGKQLSTLKMLLHQDEELQKLAKSPLMLSIMSLAYQNCALGEVVQGGTAEEHRQHLFDIYIKRMFQRRSTTQRYPERQTRHWLIWLAQRMTTTAQTVFLIERLQPSWLLTKGQQIRYRLEILLTSMMIFGLIFGLFLGLISGLFLGLISGLFLGPSELPNGELSSLDYSLEFTLLGARNAFAIGSIGGLIIGSISGLIMAFIGDIKPVETLKWSWQATTYNLRNGLIFGLIFGLIVGGFFGLSINQGIFGLIFGLIVGGLSGGLAGGLIGGLIGGFRGSEIQLEGKPNQGIWKSAQNTTVLGVTFGLCGGLIGGLCGGLIGGLCGGLIGGLCGGLIGGGGACIQHFTLRFLLYRLRYSPWNYACFLDYATERLLLQKVGGGYIFVHRMLLEHFAQMPLEQRKR